MLRHSPARRREPKSSARSKFGLKSLIGQAIIPVRMLPRVIDELVAPLKELQPVRRQNRFRSDHCPVLKCAIEPQLCRLRIDHTPRPRPESGKNAGPALERRRVAQRTMRHGVQPLERHPSIRSMFSQLRCGQNPDGRRQRNRPAESGEIVFYFIQQPFFVRLILFGKSLAKLFEQLALFAGQLAGDFNVHLHEQVAPAAAL